MVSCIFLYKCQQMIFLFRWNMCPDIIISWICIKKEMLFDITSNICAVCHSIHHFQSKWRNSNFYLIAIWNPTCASVSLECLIWIDFSEWKLSTSNGNIEILSNEKCQRIRFIVFSFAFFAFRCWLRWKEKASDCQGQRQNKMKWNEFRMCFMHPISI